MQSHKDLYNNKVLIMLHIVIFKNKGIISNDSDIREYDLTSNDQLDKFIEAVDNALMHNGFYNRGSWYDSNRSRK